ncbi:MAG: DUF493 domain-containing protein [Desulfobulbus sp.]|jgi:putative lipoic acid-binding regulatory protein|nr:DUF493 domain-containing protein [Desulfobulbus sp.]
MNKDSCGCRPRIDYPCRWQYRIIGEDRTAMLTAISAQVDVGSCVIADGNASSGGRYLSLNLEMTVNDEPQRLRLYQVLGDHPDIRMVL